MTQGELDYMLARPGIYMIGMIDSNERTIVVSQDGKIYALKLDQELSRDGWAVGTYVTAEQLELGAGARIGTGEKGPRL